MVGRSSFLVISEGLTGYPALSHLSDSQVDLPNSMCVYFFVGIVDYLLTYLLLSISGDEQTGGDLGDSASVMAPAHLAGGQDTSARVRNTWQGWKKFEGVPIGFKMYVHFAVFR